MGSWWEEKETVALGAAGYQGASEQQCPPVPEPGIAGSVELGADGSENSAHRPLGPAAGQRAFLSECSQ